jgi:hypothetical protein
MMKKLLSISFVFLLVSGNVYAETIYCKVDTAFICSSSDCKQIKSEIFINLDTERNTYQRGDSKGIDTYNMSMYKSGNFVTAEVAGSASLKIDIVNSMNFVEVVQLGLTTYNNFGTCRLNT